MNPTNKYIADIFEILSKGKFICSNSVEDNIRKLYNVIDEQFDELYNYFMAINFILERGDEFFYFSRNEVKATLENKIEQAYRWVDVVDFFMTFNNSFAPGFRFSPSDIGVQVKIDASLKDKLENMKRVTGEGSYQERITSLIEKQLVAPGFAELENDIMQQYKVVASFNYIKQLIVSIQTQAENINEIS
ncbi:MAG: hypothetical protein JWP81_962 [Ferruginibacter sp.]|nr:hypothetical protein [Ferruginibacter sp.]